MEDQEYFNDGNQAVYDEEGRQLFGKERKRWLKEQKRSKYLDQLQQNSQSFEDVADHSYNPPEDKWEESAKEDDFIPSGVFVPVNDSPAPATSSFAPSASVTPVSSDSVSTNLANLSSSRGLSPQTESKSEVKASVTPIATKTPETDSNSESLPLRPSFLEKFKGSLPPLSRINPVQWLKKIPTAWKGRSLNDVVQEEFDAISKKETTMATTSSSNGSSKELTGAINKIEQEVIPVVGRNWWKIAKQSASVATLVTALLGGGYGAILYFSPDTEKEMLSNVGVNPENVDKMMTGLSEIGSEAKGLPYKAEAEIESNGGEIYSEIKDAAEKRISSSDKQAVNVQSVIDEVNNGVQSALSDSSKMFTELTAPPSTADSGTLPLLASGPIQDQDADLWSSEETPLHTTPSPLPTMISPLETPSLSTSTDSSATSTLTLPTTSAPNNSTGNSWLDKANGAVDQVNTLADKTTTAMNNVGDLVNSVSQEATQVRDAISQGASTLQSTMTQNTDQLSNQVLDQVSSWGTAIGQTASNVATETTTALNNAVPTSSFSLPGSPISSAIGTPNPASGTSMAGTTVPVADGFTPLNLTTTTTSPTAASPTTSTGMTPLPTTYGSGVNQSPPATDSAGSLYNSPNSNNNISTREYITKERDNLLTIADYELSDTTRWKEIGHLNTEVINALPQGTRYFPLGTKLRLPLK